jgi:hypothetical protein
MPTLVAAIRSRTASEEVVLVKLLCGPLSIRLLAERVAAGEVVSLANQRAEVDLSRDGSTWRGPLADAARSLFPEPLVGPGATTVGPAAISVKEVPKRDRSLAPWLVLGASALAAGGGAILGATSASGLDHLMTVRKPSDFTSLEGTVSTEGTAANVLFALAIGGAVTGVVLFFVQ